MNNKIHEYFSSNISQFEVILTDNKIAIQKHTISKWINYRISE